MVSDHRGQSVECLVELLGRPAERQTHEAVTVDRIEVDARRQRDAGAVEHVQAPLLGIVGQVADVAVRVEGAVRRGERGHTQFGKSP